MEWTLENTEDLLKIMKPMSPPSSSNNEDRFGKLNMDKLPLPLDLDTITQAFFEDVTPTFVSMDSVTKEVVTPATVTKDSVEPMDSVSKDSVKPMDSETKEVVTPATVTKDSVKPMDSVSKDSVKPMDSVTKEVVTPATVTKDSDTPVLDKPMETTSIGKKRKCHIQCSKDAKCPREDGHRGVCPGTRYKRRKTVSKSSPSPPPVDRTAIAFIIEERASGGRNTPKSMEETFSAMKALVGGRIDFGAFFWKLRVKPHCLRRWRKKSDERLREILFKTAPCKMTV